jgi:hypothetical protein
MYRGRVQSSVHSNSSRRSPYRLERGASSAQAKVKVAPIDDPDIRPWYPFDYRKHCLNAPWTDRPKDFYKFCGFMVTIVARRERQRDRNIDICRWAGDAIKNRTNVHEYWAEFIGEKPIELED